jgi:putative membrane protein
MRVHRWERDRIHCRLLHVSLSEILEMFRSSTMRMISFVMATGLFLAAAAMAGAGPSDAQIAAIVVTANQVDIDAGKLAVKKSHTKDVQDFAQRMITDHTGVNKSAVDLVTKLKVTPEDNPTSQSLKTGGDQNLSNLKALTGPAFDKAYIDHEVAYHQQVLDAVDKVLIPNAQNAELKALLIQVRPAFVAHLEHAKKIQGSLAGKS